MANTFDVQFNDKQLAYLEKELGAFSQTLAQAKYKIVQNTVTRAKTIIKRRVKERLNITDKYLIGDPKRGPALRDRVYNTDAGPRGVITISRRLVPLIGYRARFSRSGVTVQIDKRRPPLRIKHAFRAAVNSGSNPHTGVFTRAKGRDSSGKRQEWEFKNPGQKYQGGKLTKRGYARRLPMEEEFGPSLLGAIGEEQLTEIGQQVMKDIGDTIEQQMLSQISRFTGKSIEDVKLAYANNI